MPPLVSSIDTFNSLWPIDVTWCHGSWSTLAYVMAWWLVVLKHYLNQRRSIATFIDISIKIQNFHSWKCLWNVVCKLVIILFMPHFVDYWYISPSVSPTQMPPNKHLWRKPHLPWCQKKKIRINQWFSAGKGRRVCFVHAYSFKWYTDVSRRNWDQIVKNISFTLSRYMRHSASMS